MFTKTSLFFCALFLTAALLAAVWLFQIAPEDKSAFEEICKSAAPKVGLTQAPQSRQGVTKEIWRSPYHVSIQCASSDLVLQKRALVETMREVACRVEHKEAVYTVTAQEAHYAEHEIHLRGHVAASGPQGWCYADAAVIVLEESSGHREPKSITLTGNVALHNPQKGHYALADRLVYLPASEEATFSSSEGKKVLFLDEHKQMQLSARVVTAVGKEQVRGQGDVRVVLHDEELAKFKAQFHKETR